MKVIDLLNKIANGEEVPKRIKYKSIILCYHEEEQDYNSYWGRYLFEHLFKKYETKSFINDEIEIIEDTPKKIEKLKNWYSVGLNDKYIKTENIFVTDKKIVDKLNELIDYINNKEENNE